MLALETPACDVLKEISENSPSLYSDIWDSLQRRFGILDEERESRRKYEQRRQGPDETLCEFQQALIALYRLAWPTATEEQRDASLKIHFEAGLISS